MKDTLYTLSTMWKKVSAMTTKTAGKFRQDLRKATRTGDIATWRRLVSGAICRAHRDKMLGMWSLSTSSLCNHNCKRQSKLKTWICSHCFSNAMQNSKRCAHLKDKLTRNTLLLAYYDIPAEAMPKIKKDIFRLESFGDLINETQFRNYLKLVKANPQTRFTIWTKLPLIMRSVFKTEEKPENLTIIYSSPLVNDTRTIADVQELFPFVDKIFTVYDKDYTKDHHIAINCGAKCCNTCRICYNKNDIKEVKESLKEIR